VFLQKTGSVLRVAGIRQFLAQQGELRQLADSAQEPDVNFRWRHGRKQQEHHATDCQSMVVTPVGDPIPTAFGPASQAGKRYVLPQEGGSLLLALDQGLPPPARPACCRQHAERPHGASFSMGSCQSGTAAGGEELAGFGSG
jgi:hypothetical protein